MEDNNHNLENYFRRKFNQPIEPQDWNTPENEIWDGIASELGKEDKKRRVGILPLLLAGAGLLIILSLSLENYRKGKTVAALHQELRECSQKNSISDTESITADQLISVSAANSGLPNKSVINPIKKSAGFNPQRHQNNFRYQTTKPGGYQKKQYNISEAVVRSEIIVASVTKDIPETIHLKTSESKVMSELYIPILKRKTLNRLKFQHIMNLPALDLNAKPAQKTGSGFQFGPVVRYVYWQDKIKGSLDHPLSELLIKEETTPSIAVGFAISKKMGRQLILNTGMQYFDRNQTSQYAINLPYSTADEINVGSEYENRFEHSLPTGLGNINTSLVLSRAINSPVKNNENVHLDFSLQNHTKAVAVPLTLSYYLNKSGQGLFVEGGLFNEVILVNKIKEINTESHHTFVRDKSIAVEFNESQINKFNVSTMVGIGYQKRWHTGIGISMSAQYGFALTNTFATSNYQHKIDQIGVQMQVLKSLE